MRLCGADFSNDENFRGAKRNVGKCTRGKCGKYGVMRTAQLAGASRGVTRMRCVDFRKVSLRVCFKHVSLVYAREYVIAESTEYMGLQR